MHRKWKNDFHCRKDILPALSIWDSVADQDLTKDPSSIADVVLRFPHLAREEQLENISIV